MSDDHSWVSQLRALPTRANHMLKVDYIDVNLNNSRKLMGNINRLGETTDHTVDSHQELVDALTPLEVISHELAWLNPESQPRVSPSPASAAASTAGKTLSDGSS